MLTDELIPKGLRSLESCLLVNNYLYGKWVTATELEPQPLSW